MKHAFSSKDRGCKEGKRKESKCGGVRIVRNEDDTRKAGTKVYHHKYSVQITAFTRIEMEMGDG